MSEKEKNTTAFVPSHRVTHTVSRRSPARIPTCLGLRVEEGLRRATRGVAVRRRESAPARKLLAKAKDGAAVELPPWKQLVRKTAALHVQRRERLWPVERVAGGGVQRRRVGQLGAVVVGGRLGEHGLNVRVRADHANLGHCVLMRRGGRAPGWLLLVLLVLLMMMRAEEPLSHGAPPQAG